MVEMKEGKLAVRRDGATGIIEKTAGGHPFTILWNDGYRYHYRKDGIWVCAEPYKSSYLDVVHVCAPPPKLIEETHALVKPWLDLVVSPIVQIDRAVEGVFAVALSGGLGYLLGTLLVRVFGS